MRMVGLDGRTYPVDLTAVADPDSPKSSYHLRARAVLKALFPVDRVCEELYLPGTGGLRADFYLPLRRLVVEVQGEQHYRHTPFFHRDADGFARARQRDGRKIEFTSINALNYVALPYDATDAQWRNLIIQATSG